MSSRIFSCFITEDHIPTPTNDEKTINVAPQEQKTNEPLAMPEETQLYSPLNAEVVQCGENLALKQPNNIGNCDKPCINGLELVLKAYESTIVKNTTDETIMNQTASDQECSSTEKFTFAESTSIDRECKRLYKGNKSIQNLGKHIKSSKTKITWAFNYGDIDTDDAVPHCVTLTWSKFSSRVVIHMDEIEILSKKINQSSNDSLFIHKWNDSTSGLTLEVLAAQKVNSGLSLTNHDLTVNGELYDHFLCVDDTEELASL